MTLFGLSQGARNWLTCAVAAALALTLAPAQGRCESCSVLRILIEMTKPKKPMKPQYAACPVAGCPFGGCRGAACMPCCPVACGQDTCQQRTSDRISVNGERVMVIHCGTCEHCEACEIRVDKPVLELRRQCAEHERIIRELQAVVNELQRELNAVRTEMQQMRQFPPQLIYPPYNNNDPRWPNYQQFTPPVPMPMPSEQPSQSK